MRSSTRSDLHRRALELIPGGVNLPVRAMKAVGLDEPFFVERGEGAQLVDQWTAPAISTWAMSRGPPLFGHADPATVEAVREAAQQGTSFGARPRGKTSLRPSSSRGAVRGEVAPRLLRSGGLDERAAARHGHTKATA